MRSICAAAAATWLLGCADDPGDAVQAPSEARLAVMEQRFDDLPLGTLGAPWIVSSVAGATATVVESPTGDGQALELSGDGGDGAFLVARLNDFHEDAPGAELRFDVIPDFDSKFIVELRGSGALAADRRVEVIRGPSVDFGEALYASSGATGGPVRCAKLPQDVSAEVRLRVYADLGTFDVDVDDQPTDCAGLPTAMQPPYESMSVVDSGAEFWGGTATFDNFHLTTVWGY